MSGGYYPGSGTSLLRLGENRAIRFNRAAYIYPRRVETGRLSIFVSIDTQVEPHPGGAPEGV
ncbi:hypothetical protein, partial [Acidiphilium sp.]|uniref:hypothetical protein n=1 Tax=Acidiphilium sp. TaxID=527 RepID=UPI002582FBAD